MKKNTLFLITGILFSTLSFSQSTYNFDKAHAKLSFSVKHLGISFVDGLFKNFSASLVASKEDFSDAEIEMTADVKSINTDVEMRDKDLQESWFEVDKFPTLSFKSMAFNKVSGNNYELKGNITMHGITKFIVFDVIYNGKSLNPYSKKYSVGFTVTGKLMRSDFGVGKEGVEMVGNEILLHSNVEFIIN